MIITWIKPRDLVVYELLELEETGIDVSALRRRWETLEGNKDTGQDQLAEAFLDELAPATTASADSAEEPSTLERIAAACETSAPRKLYVPGESALADRVAAGWFGRAAGCLLGKPVEKIPRQGIRELLTSNGAWPLSHYVTAKGIPPEVLAKYSWNRHYGRESLRENIVCMAEDDDLNYPMLNLTVLESAGTGFTTEQVAEVWLGMLPVLATFTAERVAYANLLRGILPPATAVHRNPYREWIGAQIRGDVFGWVSPGRPLDAAMMAYKDARLSHVRNGMYGEMFVAGMLAAACALDDPAEVVRAGLGCVPTRSRFAEAVRFALSLPSSESTWEGAVDRLYDRYGRFHWVHTLNNASLVVAAILYGNGDYERSICNVVMGGWDTDSNGATVGSVVGTMLGRVPDRWVAPLNNRIRSSLKGFDNSPIHRLAERTLKVTNSLT